MTVTESREPSVVREEITDLINYLNGLPEGVRDSGAFAAYEQRVGELSRELVLADAARVLPLREGADFEVLVGELHRLTSKSQRWGGDYSLSKISVWLSAGILAGAAMELATRSLVPMIVAEAGLILILGFAVQVGFSWKEKRRMSQIHIEALQQVVKDSFGPRGEVLRPSEYYHASITRMESLLDTIKAEK